MPCYEITMSSDGGEIEVLLRGPGIRQDGRRYIFANTDRCASFVEAVNFAYEQGLRDGMRGRRQDAGRLLIVVGSHPDDLRLRPETWWERLLRQARRLVRGCA